MSKPPVGPQQQQQQQQQDANSFGIQDFIIRASSDNGFRDGP
jgi:hypothetical protein